VKLLLACVRLGSSLRKSARTEGRTGSALSRVRTSPVRINNEDFLPIITAVDSRIGSTSSNSQSNRGTSRDSRSSFARLECAAKMAALPSKQWQAQLKRRSARKPTQQEAAKTRTLGLKHGGETLSDNGRNEKRIRQLISDYAPIYRPSSSAARLTAMRAVYGEQGERGR